VGESRRPRNGNMGHFEKLERADVDVAVVGAGVAGLYVAWRLLSEPAYATKSIALFDTADRVGGRILSVTMPDIPYVTELGAMRYLPDQILVRSLIEDRLQLEHSEFSFETRGYFLRGKYISQEAVNLAKATNSPKNVFGYDVHESENGKTPIELIILAIQRTLRELEIPSVVSRREVRGVSVAALQQKLGDLGQATLLSDPVGHFTAKEWKMIKRYGHIHGCPLYEIGFWEIIQRFLTPEGYKLAYDGGGGFQHLNAADAIVWFLSDFTASPYQTVAGGMGQLVRKLQGEIINRSTSALKPELDVINLRWELREVRHRAKVKNSLIQLTFDVGGSVGGAAPERSITAATVILCLPQPALKSIKFYDFEMEPGATNERTTQLLNSAFDAVTANPLFKACLIYEKPWWPNENIPSSFRIFTDLPLRQIYQFGIERQLSISSSSRRSACMLMLLVDARYADYWKQLDKMCETAQRYYSSKFEKSMTETPRRDLHLILGTYGTGEALSSHLQDMLAKVTGKSAPAPIALMLKHWSDRPHQVGWHAWNVGARSWEVAGKLVRPFVDADLYTCGEAFSGEQGWIEGALKSAERVLESIGVPSPPPWVDKAEYEEQKELWM
jgi:Flavin containing amine oxidoreductase